MFLPTETVAGVSSVTQQQTLDYGGSILSQDGTDLNITTEHDDTQVLQMDSKSRTLDVKPERRQVPSYSYRHASAGTKLL